MTAPRRQIGYHCSHEQYAPGELLELAQAAEAAGFEAAMCSDHFAPWTAAQGHSGATWPWLGAALQATRLSFGTVSAPGYRYHPAVLAQSAATLAVMLLAGELVSGLWLLVMPRRRPLIPAVVFALTSVLWSTLAVQAFARGLALDNCGCFGVYLAQPLRWWVLLQDAALLGYSALLLRAARLASPKGNGRPHDATVAPRLHVARRWR